jgi:PleD family two-component response regulator
MIAGVANTRIPRGDLERDICVQATLQRDKPAMTRIVIVEDDAAVGTAIRLMLGREGCDAIHAEDAESGLRAFASSRFDLAIIDIFLRDTSALRTIAEFRQQAPAVPILAMSGFRFRGSMDRSPSWIILPWPPKPVPRPACESRSCPIN